jgi:hypothetical protein
VAYHEAYPRRSRERSTRLDILYAPIVRLQRAEGGYEFEAGIDETKIKCIADANPSPDVFWRKAGGESIFRYSNQYIHSSICFHRHWKIYNIIISRI